MNELYLQAIAAYQADPTLSQAKVAAQFGLTQSKLSKLIKANGIVPNPVAYPGCHDEKRDQVLDHYRRGMRLAAIHRVFGVSKEVVYRWLDEAGELKPQQPTHEPIVLTVFEPIQPWEDSGEIIHMGNLGRVLNAMYRQSEDDE